MTATAASPRIRFYTLRDLHRPPLSERLSPAQRHAIDLIGQVLPFRVNSYVIDELIDWGNFYAIG